MGRLACKQKNLSSKKSRAPVGSLYTTLIGLASPLCLIFFKQTRPSPQRPSLAAAKTSYVDKPALGGWDATR